MRSGKKLWGYVQNIPISKATAGRKWRASVPARRMRKKDLPPSKAHPRWVRSKHTNKEPRGERMIGASKKQI